MTRVTMDIAVARLDKLEAEQAELTAAFHLICGLTLGLMTAYQETDCEELARLIEAQARLAGEERAAKGRGDNAPNMHLVNFAHVVRAIPAGRPSLFSVIDGGKAGNDDGPDAA